MGTGVAACIDSGLKVFNLATRAGFDRLQLCKDPNLARWRTEVGAVEIS